MGTAGAFLCNIEAFIKVNNFVWANINTILTARAFLRVNNDQAVISLIQSSFHLAGFDTWSFVAMHAEMWSIGDFDFGYSTSNGLGQFDPELPGVGLRFSNRSPIIADMFVFARYLARMATVAFRYINNENFPHVTFLPLPRH
jgi:hypothetical protein